MSGNIFLDEVENEIKIQKGLKILEFASQYYLAQAYLRNSPINRELQQKQIKHSDMKRSAQQKHKQNAELMAELNQLIQKAPQQQQIQAESIQISSNNLSRIREVYNAADQKRHTSDIKNQQLSQQQIAEPSYQQQQLEQSDFLPYNSSIGSKSSQMQVIHEVSNDSSSLSAKKLIRSRNNSQNYTIRFQDLNDISQPSQSASQQKYALSQNKVGFNKKQNKQNHTFSSSSSHRPLDLSIDQIKNSSQIQSQVSNLSATELNLLKQLSFSFMKKDHLKLLLKLQNCQMQLKFIEQKMKRRMQKAVQQISKVRNISWASLNIAKPRYQFKRMAYAHVIE